MKSYLDQITAGYVRAMERFNRLDEQVRMMFAHNHFSGGEMPGDYIQVMLQKNAARKVLDRWFLVFNSACKRNLK